MKELNARAGEQLDGLFLERLDAFCHAEVKAFAERERRPLEETRKYVAEWHSRYLFQPQFQDTLTSPQDRVTRVESVLSDASRILESLCDASGVQSFFLAVDPSDASGSGFLGGSVLGREYWRGHRGGGDAGAKAFKIHCLKSVAQTPISPSTDASSSSSTSTPVPIPKLPAARSLKADLYDAVRKALRSASGVRNAEMKWTNPALLSTYGVCLVGWPPTIPAQNPSSLKASQNKELLDALESGTMHFVRILKMQHELRSEPPPSAAEEDSSFSWAVQYDDSEPPESYSPGLPPDSSVGQSTGGSESSFFVWGSDSRAAKRPRVDDRTTC
ncbi:hypothetical protein DFH07DRAFT_820649 [Mycena maculata]|uniref:Uncharacterized protein n=1 Tax=Mycena maculata TaxID=230809 RepID=A0AAD7NCT4_9AGAR|nr:hypothetical protein DFH07DRAFT_820649 [Mycena maculata]